ncbi:MAG TPA: site-specific tyrosine recombinase/integron integrase [Bacillota bacterium]|nr:site-specific tyrosine recombinase/integron integrase [Bacillota bacterium]
MSNDQILQRFYEHLRVKGYSPLTIQGYQFKMARFLSYLEARRLEIVKLTPADLEGYRMNLYYQEHRGAPLSLATQAGCISKIKVLFQYLAKENLILTDPAASLELPKLPRGLPKNILSAREIKKILNSVDTSAPLGLRDRAILETLYSSGIRVSELAQLKITDLDLGQGLITVIHGKGDKSRVTPIGKIACQYLREYIQTARPKDPNQPILFLSCRGLPLAERNIQGICESRATQAGVKKHVSPHTFRHSCATEMLRNGVDIRYIQELLGHESLRTTQVYTKVAIKDLKKVHAKCHPREKDLL